MNASHQLGLLNLLRRCAGSEPKYAIICYHTVGNTGVPYYCEFPSALFEQQIRFLKKNYRLISLSTMLAEMQNGSGSGPAVILTFDDGYRGVYESAFPIMKRYGVTATTYLIGRAMENNEVSWYDRIFSSLLNPVTERVFFKDQQRELVSRETRLLVATEIVTYLRSAEDEERLAFCKEFEKSYPVIGEDLKDRFMNWDQVATMQQEGFEFGCHTMTHPVLSRLSPEKLMHELFESKAIVERGTGRECLDFAFPFGRVTECVDSSAISAVGFRSAVTTVYGTNSSVTPKTELRRLSCGDAATMAEFAFELTRAFIGSPETESLGLTHVAGQMESARA